MEAIGDDGTFDQGSVRAAEEVSDGGYTYFEQGDVVRARVTPCFENGKGALLSPLIGQRGLGTTELFVFNPSPRIDARFLYYLTISHDFTGKGTATIYGAHGVRRVDDHFARDYRAWLPPLLTQRAIADYLDRETSRIDALVAAKQHMVELLTERWEAKRAALVSGAGLPSDDTRIGPPWLGRVPDSWSIERLKFLAKMDSGHTPDRKIEAYWVDCTVPWVTLNDVGTLQQAWTISQSTNAINELGIANSTAHLLPAGTVILSRDATVGRTAILARSMAVSQHFVGWVCGPKLLPEYLLHVLRGPMQRHFGTLTAGATIVTIGMPELNDLVLPVPPIETQRAIVSELRQVEDRVTSMRDALSRQLRLLQERRQAIITSAVTGQLDISELA
jgi:type I restriction enzyme S subunit